MEPLSGCPLFLVDYRVNVFPKGLPELDAQIETLRTEIAAGRATLGMLSELDALIEKRLDLIGAVDATQATNQFSPKNSSPAQDT